MSNFMMYGEGVVNGVLTKSISVKSLIIESTIDKYLHKTLGRVGDYTLLQLGNGKNQEIIVATKTEKSVEYTRAEEPKSRRDHMKGTPIKFVNNVYVMLEVIKLNNEKLISELVVEEEESDD